MLSYLVGLLLFGIYSLYAVVAVFGKAWGNFPYQPDEMKRFGRYNLPRRHLLCFKYFDSHKISHPGRRKVKP